jgi:hypothetical protein
MRVYARWLQRESKWVAAGEWQMDAKGMVLDSLGLLSLLST